MSVGRGVEVAIAVGDGDASNAGADARVGVAVMVADGDARNAGADARVGAGPIAAGDKTDDWPSPFGRLIRMAKTAPPPNSIDAKTSIKTMRHGFCRRRISR